ncbi:MAG: phage tail sheath subtilisin-like domain-containing protein, partial [Bacteroidetes bacterium]|nr:phage tail sheath subtilisin-like domain-containing protein [Bacteroidota bacterium]
MGPSGVPVNISSFDEYQRIFGGLASNSMLSYAVEDYFVNGGRKALIVRLNGLGAKKAVLRLPCAGNPASELQLEAVNEGAWGNELSVQIVRTEGGGLLPLGLRKKQSSSGCFGVKIFLKGILEETFSSASLIPGDAAFLPALLEANSRLLRVMKTSSGWTLPGQNPLYTLQSAPASGGYDGAELRPEDYLGSEPAGTGLYALRQADLFNLLCIPPARRGGDTNPTVYRAALRLCVERRAILLVDAPSSSAGSAIPGASQADELLGYQGTDTRNAAVYFPRLIKTDRLQKGQQDVFVPCGAVAGIIAAIDERRGVWKAPAGMDALLKGVKAVQVNLTEAQMANLNASGINNIRATPDQGILLWGARTLRGSDRFADEYKYLSVRRTALYIEESVLRGTAWTCFEHNDEALWKKLSLQVEDFLMKLFRAGAFQGNRPSEAYFVKCGKDTTTQQEIDNGILNLLIGFAPLKPAEFLLLKLQLKVAKA